MEEPTEMFNAALWGMCLCVCVCVYLRRREQKNQHDVMLG